MKLSLFLSAALAVIVTLVRCEVTIIEGPDSREFDTSEASGTRYVLKQLDQIDVAPVPGVGEDQAEFSTYDVTNSNIWVVDSQNSLVNILKVSETGTLSSTPFSPINLTAFGSPNSVAINSDAGLVAIACSPGKDQNGLLVFFNAKTGAKVNEAATGRLPDHVSFGPGNKCAYTADEGEPSYDGSPPIAEEAGGMTSVCVSSPSEFSSATLNPTTFLFTDLALSQSEQERISNNGGLWALPVEATLEQDLEPEYITYGTPDASGRYEIYVGCQENNLIAVFSTDESAAPSFERFQLLGYKNHSLPANGIDLDKDLTINIATYRNVLGMYQPDTIKMVRRSETDYIVTANEGDTKTWGEDYGLIDETQFNNVEEVYKLVKSNGVENTEVSQTCLYPPFPAGDRNAYVFGGRSFSVFNAKTGDLVFDSGSQMERMVAKYMPAFFNVKDGGSKIDNRSGKKGPEPESLASGTTAGGAHLLFVGLERVSAIGIWDIDDIEAPVFHSLNGYTVCEDDEQMNNVDPEAMTFVPAAVSPTQTDLLIASGSVSNTITVYEVTCSSTASDLGPRKDPTCPGAVDITESACPNQSENSIGAGEEEPSNQAIVLGSVFGIVAGIAFITSFESILARLGGKAPTAKTPHYAP